MGRQTGQLERTEICTFFQPVSQYFPFRKRLVPYIAYLVGAFWTKCEQG